MDHLRRETLRREAERRSYHASNINYGPNRMPSCLDQPSHISAMQSRLDQPPSFRGIEAPSRHDGRTEPPLDVHSLPQIPSVSQNLHMSSPPRGKTTLKTDHDIRMASRQTRIESMPPAERAEQEKWAHTQLQQSAGRCPMGFTWGSISGGYICLPGGRPGNHMVTHELLAEGKGRFYQKTPRDKWVIEMGEGPSCFLRGCESLDGRDTEWIGPFGSIEEYNKSALERMKRLFGFNSTPRLFGGFRR